MQTAKRLRGGPLLRVKAMRINKNCGSKKLFAGSMTRKGKSVGRKEGRKADHTQSFSGLKKNPREMQTQKATGWEGRKETGKEGRKEGRKQARKEGRREGRNQGTNQGTNQERRKEGMKEGRKEGTKKRRKEERKKGREEAFFAAQVSLGPCWVGVEVFYEGI